MDGHTAVADRTSTIQPPNEEAEAKARKMAYAITFLDAMRVHSDNDKPLKATDQ